MRHWIAIALAITGLTVVGCQKELDKPDPKLSKDSPAAMGDACPHCPGVQTATADGKCPVCGMPVASMQGHDMH